MISSVDHIAGVTGLNPTVTIRKVGGSFATPSGAVSEVGNGWYEVAGNATDANTLGPLLLHATAAGADPCDEHYDVVTYDPLGGGTTQTVTQDYLGEGSLVVEDRNTGQAIVGATVKAYSAAAYESNGSLAPVIASTTTDTNGHWSLDLTAAEYTIVFGYGANQNTIDIVVH